MITRLKSSIPYVVYFSVFLLGYIYFLISGKTNKYAYISFRRLFYLSRGGFNDACSWLLGKTVGKYDLTTSDGLIQNLDRRKLSHIISELETNGYYCFEDILSEEKIDALTEFAEKAPVKAVTRGNDTSTSKPFDRTNLSGPRYDFNEADLMVHPIVQSIATDPSFMQIAQEYLGARPIQDLTAMWWSVYFNNKASSEAAQLYHCDMDRIKFVKFFIYLTDVDTTTGPHCYIRGSHQTIPDGLNKEGRIKDEEINKAFAPEDIKEIIGKKGSIIAVDTRGFHKGKMLQSGERLILQVEYTNSLFGAPYEKLALQKETLAPEVSHRIKKYKKSYSRYSLH